MTYATVSIWPEKDPDSKETRHTDQEGVVTFDQEPPGDYMIEWSHRDHCHCTRGPYKLVENEKLRETVPAWEHHGIKGKVWFEDDEGDVIEGDPEGIETKLLQGETEKQGGSVDTTQNGDGSYTYEIMPPMEADSYTVRATCGENTQTKGVTVPDECSRTHPDNEDGGTTVLFKGAHSDVDGPEFTFAPSGSVHTRGER